MKKTYIFLTIILATQLAISCQQEEDVTSRMGYLRVDVGTNTYVSTRVDENYNPEQIALQIVNSNDEVVESTDDWTTLQGRQIELVPGTYTVRASSNGFNGMESGFDIPYYAGSTQIIVEAGKEVTAGVECTLANVKVTVNFDPSLADLYKSISTTVASAMKGIASLSFTMGDELKPAYFPVADLTATLSVTNQSDETHTLETPITNVEARHHYILNYKPAEEGTLDGVTVSVNGDETVYEFEFKTNTQTKTSLTVTGANAWSNFAYVEGSAFTGGEETLDNNYMYFEYQTSGASDWLRIAAPYDSESETYKTTLPNLTPSTAYSYRLIYENGATTYTSNTANFTTEEATVLHNGNFDSWTTGSKDDNNNTIYPGEASEAGNTTCFWNTSNPGTSQGMGAIGGAVNPTTGVTSPVHTNGGYAALLKSTNKLTVFAAASLYTGNFLGLDGMSANMEFGKPFTSRPSALHGYYKYTPEVINHVDRIPDGVAITANKTIDQCAIYIALATKSFTFNNKKEEEYIDYANDPAIIAYGELPSGGATTGDGYTEFTIPLVYRDLTTKPTHIIIVCSASKYGDYMTGADNSTLYVDDFELIYGEPTVE